MYGRLWSSALAFIGILRLAELTTQAVFPPIHYEGGGAGA